MDSSDIRAAKFSSPSTSRKGIIVFCLRRNRHLLHTQAEADIQLARRKRKGKGGSPISP